MGICKLRLVKSVISFLIGPNECISMYNNWVNRFCLEQDRYELDIMDKIKTKESMTANYSKTEIFLDKCFLPGHHLAPLAFSPGFKPEHTASLIFLLCLMISCHIMF